VERILLDHIYYDQYNLNSYLVGLVGRLHRGLFSQTPSAHRHRDSPRVMGLANPLKLPGDWLRPMIRSVAGNSSLDNHFI